MASTPRTHDEERNEKQRGEDDRRNERGDKQGDDRRRLLEEKPSDYIERTRPEDRLDDTSRHGQQTRDNVNPAIPSAKPGEGGIVDPNSLGMSQAQEGIQPPERLNQPEQWPERDPQTGRAAVPDQQEAPLAGQGSPHSINEPPGSTIGSAIEEEGGGGSGGTTPTTAPVLNDIDPDTAEIGDEDLTLHCTGTGFTDGCKIVFNGGEEPTVFVSETEVTTIVRPMSAEVAGEYPVQVRNAAGDSDAVMFEFTVPEAAGTRKKGRR